MSFTSEAGYIPATISELMAVVRENVNTQFGTTYDEETFLGTNFYKYFYALVQRLQENEVKTSEIFLRMQEYFVVTNERLQRPQTTHPGIIDVLTAAGYVASTKAPIDADAGKAYVCIDTDSGAANYAVVKLALCNIIKDCIVAGVISQGTESSSIALSNGQSFDFKFNLPTKVPIKLKLTTVLSLNNQVTILAPADQKALLYANIVARYRLGMAFEPQRYFSVLDAPWASSVLLEWSDDAGANWHSTVSALAYNYLYTFAIGDITLVET